MCFKVILAKEHPFLGWKKDWSSLETVEKGPLPLETRETNRITEYFSKSIVF